MLLNLFAMYGLTFLIKEADGPFDICAKIRNKLINNKYVGVFFYKLLDCYFCTGFWSGIIVGLLSRVFDIKLILWGLAGAAFSFYMNSWITSIYYQEEPLEVNNDPKQHEDSHPPKE